MPACVSHTRFPMAGMAVQLVPVMDDVWMSWPSVPSCCADIYFAFDGAIHVPDPDATVFAAAIYVPRVSAPLGAEVTPDEGFEDAVASECDNRAVVRIGAINHVFVGMKPVVELPGRASGVDVLEFIRAHHLPQIPKFHHLVFAITEDISSVAFTIHVRDTFSVADEDTGFPSISHRSSIPDPKGLIVRARVEDMWGGGVGEADSVDIFLVIAEPKNGLPGLKVEYHDGVFRSTGNNFAAVAREAQAPNTEASTTPM